MIRSFQEKYDEYMDELSHKRLPPNMFAKYAMRYFDNNWHKVLLRMEKNNDNAAKNYMSAFTHCVKELGESIDNNEFGLWKIKHDSGFNIAEYYFKNPEDAVTFKLMFG